MNFRWTLFRWMQDFSNQSEGQLWIFDLNLAGKIQGRVFRNDQAGRFALLRSFEKFFIFHVGNVSIAGRIKTGYARNHDRAIAGNAATDVGGKFRDSEGFDDVHAAHLISRLKCEAKAVTGEESAPP